MVIEPLVVEKLGFTVVGLEITTRPRSNAIAALWGQFAPRIAEVDAIAEPGVSYGVMENFDALRSSLDYMAAVSVTSTERIPSGMVAKAIGPSTYAVFSATLATLGDAFSHIFNAWVPQASYARRIRPLAICVFHHAGRTLVQESHDPSSV